MLKIYNNIKIRCGNSFYGLRTFNKYSTDTIFALSSGQGKCGVAVIRISGPQSGQALMMVTNLKELPKPRTALLRRIIHPITQEILDKGLILWFPGPRSFTGEDSFELQVHGGLAVINSVLDALQSIPKVRLSNPGEFTRRAFLNAKLDLTEVEGLSDLLQAETEAQRKQAFLQSQGSLSKLYNKWKTSLIKSVAHVEAHIDFEETDTLELGLMQVVHEQVKELANEIEKHLLDGRKGEILRNGVKAVILGEPNAGKSSLLNILCNRPAAIVTPIEGTTRDVLEISLNINGYPLILADTAGLRSDTKDVIEKEGINRALQLYENSDLVLFILDAEKYNIWRNVNSSHTFCLYLKHYAQELNLRSFIKEDAEDIQNLFTKNCIVIINKTDLENVADCLQESNVIKVSCKTKNGIIDLVNSISHELKILCGDPSHEHPSMNQLRHRQHLADCLNCLNLFLNEFSLEKISDDSVDLVLLAEYLRKALGHLGKLVGTVTTDQLLDVIFKDFCIGK